MYLLQQSNISQNSLAVGVHWFTMLTLGVGILRYGFQLPCLLAGSHKADSVFGSQLTPERIRPYSSFQTCLSSVPISGCHDVVQTTLKFLSVFRLVLRMYVYVYTYIYIYVHVFRIIHIYVKHIKRQYLI